VRIAEEHSFLSNERGCFTNMQQHQKQNNPLRRNEDDVTSRETVGQHIEAGAENVVEEAQEEVAAARRPWYQTRRWGGTLLLVYVVLIILFGILAWGVYVHPVLAPDVTITHAFQENQSPWLRTAMLAVSAIGDIQVLSAGLVVLAAVIFWLVDLRLEAIMIVAVSVTSGILDALIKSIVARPRPTAHLVDIISAATGNSFPSGHVMSYVAFWGLLFSFGLILFKGRPWWRITLLILSGLLVVLVGPSRVYLGAHWTSDVLGAYMLGGVCLGIWLWIYLYLKGKGILAPRPSRTSHFRKYIK
jgi:membrane-associated phospholipid phosphatase